MAELGHGDHYHIRFRHFVLVAKEQISIEAVEQLFMLVEPMGAVNIESAFGMYDLTVDNSNELQYEHQGTIRIANYTSRLQHVRFIQVIPYSQNPKIENNAIDRGKI